MHNFLTIFFHDAYIFNKVSFYWNLNVSVYLFFRIVCFRTYISSPYFKFAWSITQRSKWTWLMCQGVKVKYWTGVGKIGGRVKFFSDPFGTLHFNVCYFNVNMHGDGGWEMSFFFKFCGWGLKCNLLFTTANVAHTNI